MTYPVLTNEPELLQKLANGDEHAFTIIYGHYPPIVRKFLLTGTSIDPTDAEDLVQDVFARIWTLRDTMGQVEDFKFKGYAFSMSRNLFLNSVRHRKVKAKASYHLSFSEKVDYTSIEDNILYKFYNKSARKAIDRLPVLERKVFDLTTVYDYTQVQIAGELKISRVTVRKYVQSANNLIINHLKDHAEWMSTLFPIFFIIIEKYLSKNFPF